MRQIGRGCFRIAGFSALALGSIVLLLAGWVVILNRDFPSSSSDPARISALDLARVAEARHLRANLGGGIWPGWDRPDIPVILYNESHAFLLGYPEPPSGWQKFPGSSAIGGPWERVDGDPVYYRQRLDPGVSPEAFTVVVGDRWVASIPTLEWFRISLANRIRSEAPAPVSRLVPYDLITDLFIGGSDGWITLLLHETFHAWQGSVVPDRLIAAEEATAMEQRYEQQMDAMDEAWRAELALLRDAISESSTDGSRRLALEFILHRRSRRAALDDPMIEYEQLREWLEGLAKYAELAAWREASASKSYRPVLAESSDQQFEEYRGFGKKWQRELGEMKRSASSDVRFYYSGMAQAMLLDRIAPQWKERALEDPIPLDRMIETALGTTE